MKSSFLRTSLIGLILAAAVAAEDGGNGNGKGKDDFVYKRRSLVSDLKGQGATLDPNLKNPWGIAFGGTGPFWIADNKTGVSTLYDGDGNPAPAGHPLVVTIPPPAGGQPPAAPTGIVFNGTTSFDLGGGHSALFIFSTEDGTISGWNPQSDATHAIRKADLSATGAVYKGLALGNNGSADFLYATNFHAGTVDVFNSSFALVTLSGTFADPTLPAGFAPFGIRNLGGKLYVTYAKQDADKHDDLAGPGHGYVNVFDTNGNLLQRLISGGALNSPWGIALAPSNFGELSNTLLIGNFGDGTIHGFNPATGALIGGMDGHPHQPLVIAGLWGLTFGNGGQGGDSDKLYFTAGIPGPDEVEDHGLFGSIEAKH